MQEKIETATNVITYTSSGTAVWFALFTTNDLAALAGICLGSVSVVANIYFARQRVKILKQEKRN